MIAALLFAAGIAPSPIPPSVATTIEEIRRDPRRWDGKWVQIEGWINSCRSTDCTLAERAAARPSNRGMSLSFETQQSFDQWVKPMLPLKARVVARVDAACLLEVCLDRAPVLRGMIVEPIQPNAKFPDEEQ